MLVIVLEVVAAVLIVLGLVLVTLTVWPVRSAARRAGRAGDAPKDRGPQTPVRPDEAVDR